MTRWFVLGVLLLVAATPEETKLLRVAEISFGDKLYDFAERQLTEFLDKYPASEHSTEVRLMLAQAQLGQGKWEQALVTLRAASPKDDAQRVTFEFWRAEALSAGERHAEAEKVFRDVLQQDAAGTNRAGAQYGLAFTLFKLNQYEAAENQLRELINAPQREKVNLQAELLQGQILLAQLKFEAAEQVFEGLINRDKESRWAFRAQRWRGELFARQGEWEKAIKRYRLVTESFQHEPNKLVDAQLAAEAWAGIGWVHWNQNQFNETIEPFSQALTHARERWLRREVMVKLGEAYVRAGKLAQGVARLKDFLKESPKDPLAEEVQLAIGDLFYTNGDFGAALAEYKELIARYPQSRLVARAHFQAGWCAAKQDHLTDALPYFQRAFQEAAAGEGPGADAVLAAEALFKVADIQFQIGQLAEAVASYQRLVSSYPDSPVLDHAMFQLGHVYQRMQNTEAAVHVFTSLVDKFPQSKFAPEARFQVGEIQSGLGEEAKARDAYVRVATDYPQTEWAPRARLAVGKSYYRAGAYEKSIVEFDKLTAAAPDSELGQRAMYNRGWSYYALAQPEKTLLEFDRFIEKYTNSTLVADMLFWEGDYFVKQKDYVRAQERYQAIHKNHGTSQLADAGLFFAGRAAYARQDYKNAIELFETLVKNYTNSTWRCAARFGQGDAFTERNQFEDALLVFDSLIKQFPDCDLICDALGRRGDCLYTAERYEEAIVGYRDALTCARDADATLTNQLRYKLGQSYEKSGKTDDALAQYTEVVYGTVAWADPNIPPEQFWLAKAGLAAGALREQNQQWREAITIYGRIIGLCPEMKELLEERIRRLRVEHFILF